MIRSEHSNMFSHLERNEWGIVQRRDYSSLNWQKVSSVPDEIHSIVSFSQSLVQIIYEYEHCLVNIDYSIPIYIYEKVIISTLLEKIGNLEQNKRYMSAELHSNDRLLEKLAIISFIISYIIINQKSCQIVCGSEPEILICVNHIGVFSGVNSGSAVNVFNRLFNPIDCQPLWLLEMIAEEQDTRC